MQAKVFKKYLPKVVAFTLVFLVALVCIAVPSSTTYAAESTEVFSQTIEFPADEFSLRVTPTDGSSASVTYVPGSDGSIQTFVPSPGYYFTTEFYHTITELDSPYGIKEVKSFGIYVHFGVYEPYADQKSFINITNYECLVNGHSIDLVLGDFEIYDVSANQYDVTAVFILNLADFASYLDGVEDVIEFAIDWEPSYTIMNPYYYGWHYQSTNAYIKYIKHDAYTSPHPMSPEDQAIINGMNQKGDEMEAAGDEISGAVDQLESMMPDVGDPFQNAPDYQVYATGSQFFIQLFNHFYSNQMVGAFISFALIMALVVFIMRR